MNLKQDCDQIGIACDFKWMWIIFYVIQHYAWDLQILKQNTFVMEDGSLVDIATTIWFYVLRNKQENHMKFVNQL